ncbi:hypothetical protein GCM10009664_43540 [Kitasatospora gansuensis]
MVRAAPRPGRTGAPPVIGGQPIAQDAPLNRKAGGLALLPDQVALKPHWTLPPRGMAALA